jgi:hypothetical protein
MPGARAASSMTFAASPTAFAPLPTRSVISLPDLLVMKK